MNGVEIAGDLVGADAPFAALVPDANWDLWALPQGTGLPSVLFDRVSRTERQFLKGQRFAMVTERVQCTVKANSAEERERILDAIRNAGRDKRPIVEGLTGVSVLLAGDGSNFKDGDAAIYIGSTDLRVSFTKPL